MEIEKALENETPQQRTDRLFRLRQTAQLNLVQYMTETGVVKDIEDYVRLRIAEIFDFLCKGKLGEIVRVITEVKESFKDELTGFSY